ncbi:MAG: NYN domain-containing protein [Anaerovoracaceae bacterium]
MKNENRPVPLTTGILAHVDAGKTTLSEAILYLTGSIRKLGRVDHKDAFLDSSEIERSRGITVFSKEARFVLGEKEVTLLDTPGHADFSAEMERTLQVLDYAILVVSGTDGVQSHTRTLWKLLADCGMPVFVFVNKMDRPGTDREAIVRELTEAFGDGFVEAKADGSLNEDEAAMASENLMEEYLADSSLSDQSLAHAIEERLIFPVYFGSALKMEGVKEFLDGFARYTQPKEYDEEFGARVYKISRDKQGNRLTHMKITGGSLKSKMLIDCGHIQVKGDLESGTVIKEKAEQIRLYSGDSFTMAGEAAAGTICAVTGLTRTYAGQGLGKEAAQDARKITIMPAITARLITEPETDPVLLLAKLRQLEEENPTLHVIWKEELKEIHVQVMGELEQEILKNQIKERFDENIDFGEGSIIYKETIAQPVIGIGHFEPLRHYAEVQLLMEPLPEGSGLVFDSLCSEDKLDRNWQRLIMTHLMERVHPGVLTGSEITDMKITILAGRAHLKNTEGGDFRQATYRAIRQGLRKAESVLLEPFYTFTLKIPQENTGRAMSDMQRLGASCSLPEVDQTINMSVITGEGPVSTLRGYQREVSAYTRGEGRFEAALCGFRPCHNEAEIIAEKGYRPEEDIENPTGSVFCDHGAAVYVDWQQVDGMAHVDSGYIIEDGRCIRKGDRTAASGSSLATGGGREGSRGLLSAAGEKELQAIFERTYGKSKRDEALRREAMSKGTRHRRIDGPENFPQPNWKHEMGKGQPFLIIDGYNVIFAWEELKELAAVNLDSAREAFLDILGNYQGYKKMGMVVVFDGYKVAGNPGTKVDYGEIKVVYTKEAETADRFIEKTIYEMGRKYDVAVVTSDRPVQMAALGDGARRMSAREFYGEVTGVSEEIRAKLAAQKGRVGKNRPFEEKLKTLN